MTPWVSTGRLPAEQVVARAVQAAHRRFAAVDDGAVSVVYPALARADPSSFGLAAAAVDGRRWQAGDAAVRFTLMSVSKPFVLALVAQERGLAAVRDLVGVNATGLAFNAAGALERDAAARTNPMVNPGAIATTSLVPGADLEHRWQLLADGLSAFAGRALAVDDEVVDGVRTTNRRNRALSLLLADRGALVGDPEEAVELYNRQCCLAVDASDLAVMGATLADGGVNPVTGRRVVDAQSARTALVAMTVAGLYETSGDWLLDVGVPGKSGISGGIVAVSPGKGALGSWSPPLDAAGNSVRGQLAAAHLAREVGLDLFAGGVGTDPTRGKLAGGVGPAR